MLNRSARMAGIRLIESALGKCANVIQPQVVIPPAVTPKTKPRVNSASVEVPKVVSTPTS